MIDLAKAGSFPLGTRSVKRMGYGAMQLAGRQAFGPPKDRNLAVAVLRGAFAAGIEHIDTSDFYGPHTTNQIIYEALYPYPDDLVIVTKVGASRGPKGSWDAAYTTEQLTNAVHDNLRNLGVDVLDVVNLRMGTGATHGKELSLEREFTLLAELQQQGLIRHLGVSTVSAAQIAEARAIAPIVCVQNQYNIAYRGDDALIDALAADGIAYVPYFPLGGFAPLKVAALNAVATELAATPMQVALAWLLHRSPNMLLIPGTSSLLHLEENLAAAALELSPDALATLDTSVDRRANLISS